MGLLFKIIGVTIALVAVIFSNTLMSVLDVKTITTSNDFVTAIIQSPSVVTIIEQVKYYVAVMIGAFGCCFGLLAFGIGMILSRLRKMNRRLAQG